MTTEQESSFAWLGPAPVEYRFYNGTVAVYYDDEQHSYTRYEGGVEVLIPGVTSAVHILDKSAALTQWAANKTVEYIRGMVAASRSAYPAEEILSWMEAARFNHRTYKEAAAETGHIAHAWLEDYISALTHNDFAKVMDLAYHLPEDKRAANGCVAALDWMQRHKVRWIFTERKIYSREYDYAGTCDGLCYVSACGDPDCCGSWIKNEAGKWERVAAAFVNVLAVADWKTSNGLYPEYDYQTAAYLKALNEENGTDILYRFVTRLGKEDGQFESRMLLPDVLEGDLQTFVKCLSLYRTINARAESEKQRKAEIKQQVREDKAAAEEAAKAERKAAREAAKAARAVKKDEQKAMYKKLRSEGMSVEGAKAVVYGGEPEQDEEQLAA